MAYEPNRLVGFMMGSVSHEDMGAYARADEMVRLRGKQLSRTQQKPSYESRTARFHEAIDNRTAVRGSMDVTPLKGGMSPKGIKFKSSNPNTNLIPAKVRPPLGKEHEN